MPSYVTQARLDLPTIMIVGKPKVGKTRCVMKALGPDIAFWLGTERHVMSQAMIPEVNPSRRMPDHVMCLDYEDPCGEAKAALLRALNNAQRRGKQYGFGVIDTLSTLADREYNHITLPKRQGGLDIAEAWGRAARELARRLRPILDIFFAHQMGVIALAHDREPTYIEGNQTYGGPRLPGKLVEVAPSLFGTTIRLDITGLGKRTFHTHADDRTYMLGDSTGVVEDGMEADLAEVLRRMILRARGQY